VIHPLRARTLHVAMACVAALSLGLLGGCATLAGGDSAVLRAKDKVAPALVHIRPVKEVYAQGEREEVLIVGSGFIITADGYVVTNEHVAGESRFVRCVLSDKTEVEAKVVGVDPFTDIAVLKLETDRRLPFVRMGDSDHIQAGQTVLALGSPHGLARSVSMGIVSVTDRYLD
jgi:serine protease Do